jgi:hypothetical protein
MSFELAADDPWVKRGYGQARIEPGTRPAVLVIDLQYAFTDPAFEFGGAELIERATVNTARLLETARAAGVPVFPDGGRLGGGAGQRPLDDQASALRPHHPGVALGAGRRAGVGGQRPAPPEEVAVLLPRDAPPLLLTAAHCDTVREPAGDRP